MEAWTNGQVLLSLSEVRELPVEEVRAALQLGDSMSIMVLVDVVGTFGGQLVLQFDEDGTAISRLLTGAAGQSIERLGTLETSALAETGNILASAYLNRITLMTGCRVMPAPPTVVQDFAAGVLESAIITQAISGDRVLLCRTQFRLRGEPIEWNVFFVPSPELLRALRDCAASTTAMVV